MAYALPEPIDVGPFMAKIPRGTEDAYHDLGKYLLSCLGEEVIGTDERKIAVGIAGLLTLAAVRGISPRKVFKYARQL